MRARRDISDGLFHVNLFLKAKMNALTSEGKGKPVTIAFSPRLRFIA